MLGREPPVVNRPCAIVALRQRPCKAQKVKSGIARKLMESLPLAGVTVVAVEQAVAVPFATRQLADLGARVIKIERPVGGDFARAYDTTVHGMSSHFVWLNRGKESLTLDLKQPEAQLVIGRLLDSADIFVQNLA